MHPCGARALQRGARAAVQDVVAVNTRRVARGAHGIPRDFPGPLQRDGRRQLGVGAQHPGARRALQRGVEVDDLADRVHAASVRPAQIATTGWPATKEIAACTAS
jgi:hypothetical protein